MRMLESLIRLAQGMFCHLQWTFPLSDTFSDSHISSFLRFYFFLVVAHARLMFRNEVTQLDAIAAILCIESSMTISAIIDGSGNALNSNFQDNPDQECILAYDLELYLCISNI